MSAIRRAAKQQRMTVAGWVRPALRVAYRRVPQTDAQKKLDVVRIAARHDFPTGDIDQVLCEIDRGYQVISLI